MVVTHNATRCVCYANGMSLKPFKYANAVFGWEVFMRKSILVCYYNDVIICIQYLKKKHFLLGVSCSQY
jgi:hypothetical protein